MRYPFTKPLKPRDFATPAASARFGTRWDAEICAEIDRRSAVPAPWPPDSFGRWHDSADNEWVVGEREGVVVTYMLFAWQGRGWRVCRFGAVVEPKGAGGPLLAGLRRLRGHHESVAAMVPETDGEALEIHAAWGMSSRLVRSHPVDLVEFRWPRSDAAGCRGKGAGK